MSVLLLAAAEPSRVPFFVAGGLLVLWAVGLAGYGLRQPDFPYSARGARGVVSVSLVLVLITIAAAILTDP